MSVYVAQVRGGYELKSVRELQRGGLEAYTPTVRRWCYLTGNRRKPVEQPVTPGYAFVASPSIEHDLGTISAAEGVIRVLEAAGRPLVLEGDWLARLVIAHALGLLDHTVVKKPRMTAGQQVRIIGGQFQGALAVIAELRSGGKAKLQVKTKGLFGTLILKTDQLEAA
ncbi:MAG TPA: transcription termination/antitermination NusG family protein [Stellaceae bacterium]|nr:transcription termination/antitermination NusG family protein [Stellaceae bacterium]